MGSGTWVKHGAPSWVTPGQRVDKAAPLGKARPERHRDSLEPVTRDDAPRDAGEPDFLVGNDRASWLAAGGAEPTSKVGPHDYRGQHDRHEPGAPDLGPPPELGFLHEDRGGVHTGAELKGAGGAAFGGLRRDNASAWANPEGFRLGNDYDPYTMQRAMPHGRMRAALRAFGFLAPETGSAASPPPGGRTSMFDPTGPRHGFGPTGTTQRHVLRPFGDVPATESGNVDTYGDGWQL